MKTQFFLFKLLKPLQRAFERRGISYPLLLSILRVKLSIEEERASTPTEETAKNRWFKGAKGRMAMQAILGIFVGFIMFTPLDLFYKVTVMMALNFVMMVLYMMSDFSHVLLDVRDREQIMTRPVSPQTVNAARLIHIIYYMLQMVLALNALGIIAGVVRHGVRFALVYPLVMILLSVFVVVLATLLYSLLLERFSGERLKDIINGFQVVVTIVSVVGYQLVVRIFDFVDMNLTVNLGWWSYLLPPVWFSGLIDLGVRGTASVPNLVLAGLAIFVPAILGVILVKQVMPRFERYLAKLQIEDGLFIDKNGFVARAKEWVYDRMAKNHTERAFMRFARYNFSRDRMLKLMIFPNMALALIFPFLMMLPMLRGEEIAQFLEKLPESPAYLMVYLSVMMFILSYDTIQYSERHEAAFIYKSLPVDDFSGLYWGAKKAYFMKYIVPGMVLLSAIFFALIGVRIVPDLIFIWAASALLLSLKIKISPAPLPFSQAVKAGSGKSIGPTFAMMALIGVFAGLHGLILHHNVPLLIGGAAVALLINFMLERSKIAGMET